MKKRWFATILAAMLVAVQPFAYSANQEFISPDKLEGAKEESRKELLTLSVNNKELDSEKPAAESVVNSSAVKSDDSFCLVKYQQILDSISNKDRWPAQNGGSAVF